MHPVGQRGGSLHELYDLAVPGGLLVACAFRSGWQHRLVRSGSARSAPHDKNETADQRGALTSTRHTQASSCRTTWSISASVVVRPRLNRMVPSPTSVGAPIAASTGDMV